MTIVEHKKKKVKCFLKNFLVATHETLCYDDNRFLNQVKILLIEHRQPQNALELSLRRSKYTTSVLTYRVLRRSEGLIFDNRGVF